MPDNDGLLRICCLAPSKQLGQYAALQLASWSVTSRARVVTATYGSAQALREIQRADLVYLDCSSAGFVGARAVRELIRGKPRRLVCSAGEQDWMRREPKIPLNGLNKSLVKWLVAEMKARRLRPPKVEWTPNDRELDLLRPSINLCIRPVLEMYFPDRRGPAYVYSVGGGLSGTPLVRIQFKGSNEQYYLKFYEREDEFKTEWKGHESALAWLGDSTVKLHPVPSVQEDAEGQWAALSLLNRRLASFALAPRRQFYPVCYGSAKASNTLKVHYQAAIAGSTFPRDLYTEIIKLLKERNQPVTLPPMLLHKCRDHGPTTSPTGARGTILRTLESSEYQAFIKRACDELGRFKGACNRTVNWPAGRLLLQDLLAGTLPGGMTEQYSLVHGHIHGDANSRNFLFKEKSAGAPYDLQLIDCGCHATRAPLLFDPAQLESDLKVNLMATEAASGYEEIDVAQLPEWTKMEKRSLRFPFTFKIPPGLPESVKRAYEIVQVIRGRVLEISPKDTDGQPDPRPYFYFLLYWTLRKLRHATVPPTKRLFAMASVFLLLERLK